jgi:hypothetical protein
VLSSIGIQDPVHVISDLDRANCYYNLLLGGGIDYRSGPTALDFIFDHCEETRSIPEAIPKTLIYFENVSVLQTFQAHLRDILPAHLKAQGVEIIESYYANRTTGTKTFVRVQFLVGKVCRIICTTEAFGMGMDIPDITRVFQWGLPRSVASLIQRFGRAARNQSLTACCTLVISKDYYRITGDDDFQCTNGTQKALQSNHEDIYKILRSKCLRQGFLIYLGIGNQYKPPSPGQCCSRCSARDEITTAIIGSRGLCDETREAVRRSVESSKPPHTHHLIAEEVLKKLSLWRDKVTNASLRGSAGHDLWRPAGCIPDSVLLEVAKGAKAIMDPRFEWPITRISSWYGWELWGDSKYPDHRISTYISSGWEAGTKRVEEERKEKGSLGRSSAQRVNAQRRIVDRGEGRNIPRVSGSSPRYSASQPARSRLGESQWIVQTPSGRGSDASDTASLVPSRRGSNASDVSNASATSALVEATGPLALAGKFRINR